MCFLTINVGLMTPLKCGILEKWGTWTSGKYSNLTSNVQFAVPSRTDILAWIQDPWSKIPGNMIRKT